MCGIVGYIGQDDAREKILKGLELLEYRGYDSAGIALVDSKDVKIFKDKGRVEHLREITDFSFKANTGIGHTRWATHGVPNMINSHPHQSQSGRFTIVHNGIIENFRQIKIEYLSGYNFVSTTDTEIIANLIEYFSNKMDVEKAILKAFNLLDGSYAVLIIDNRNLDKIYFAKNKTPLAIGIGKNGVCFASDIIPLAGNSDKYVLLKDKTFGYAEKDKVVTYDAHHDVISEKFDSLDVTSDAFGKGNFEHYMLKEIYEQPSVIRRIIQEYFDGDTIKIDPKIIELIKNTSKINLVACGTSMYASYMAKYYFEKLCGVRTEVFVASELAYSTPLILQNPIFIYLSQSGETADSIAVMKKFKKMHYPTICITNTVNSTMASLSDYVLDIYAGKEMAVASTKAYIAQVAVCAILAKAASGKKTKLKNNLSKVASVIEKIIDEKIIIEDIADQIYKENDAFYIGRGIDYWAGLEAALKLKEISYIHTEAYSSGELKHGSIALIKKGTPVIAICTQEGTNPIVRSNLVETVTRGAKPIVFSLESMSDSQDSYIIPDVAHYLTPLVSVVVGQLLAYYVAKKRGNDIDKPNNLAKSVTVE